MCVHISHDELKTFLEIGDFAVSAVTLFIAWKIYKNFDVKKQYLNQQLNIVNELATSISKTQIRFTFYLKPTPHPSQPDFDSPRAITGYIDFFSTAIVAIASNVKKYQKVFITGNNINRVLPFLEYRYHPLLPSTIAKELNELYLPLQYTFAVLEKDYPDNYVRLSSFEKPTDDNPMNSFTYAYKSSEALVDNVSKLRTEIRDWLKRFGAEDINF